MLRSLFSILKVMVCASIQSRVERSVFSWQRSLSNARHLVAIADSFLVDVNPRRSPDPWPPLHVSGGIFGRYGISRTPAILVTRKPGDARAIRIESSLGADGLNDDSIAQVNAATLARVIR